MTAVEFFPKRFPGLHWEAAARPEVETPAGFLLAEVPPGRVALAYVNDPRSVLLVPTEALAELKEAFAEGRFDFLLPQTISASEQPERPTSVPSRQS